MGIRIALAGNPNCGKTTMFNDLTGASQYVGNWPGVTVEKKEGKYTRDKDVIITDLPGVYSLSPYSPEEIVTRDYLLDGGPDVVVNLVDATNLERNLYLTTQILDLGVPVVVALNMMDLVKKSGDKIDVAGLSKQLGCPIVETTALKGHGMAELMETAVKAAKAGKPAQVMLKTNSVTEEAITKIEGILGNRVSPATARWFAIKLFEGEERTVANMKLSAADLKAVEAIREEVENKLDDDAESIITSERYNAITHVIDKTMKRSHKGMTNALAPQEEDHRVGEEPLAGPAHLRGGHGARVLPGHLRGHGRGHRLGQRRHLRRRLPVHRRRGLRRGRGRMGRRAGQHRSLPRRC